MFVGMPNTKEQGQGAHQNALGKVGTRPLVGCS